MMNDTYSVRESNVCCDRHNRVRRFFNFRWLSTALLAINLFLFAGRGLALAGTWTALSNAPPIAINNCLLLGDGTVLAMSPPGQCARLTPDSHGSYINGTWTMLDSQHIGRFSFSSDVLSNGNVYAAGGEVGDPGGYPELYDSQADLWSLVQPGGYYFSDAPASVLPDGNVLQSDTQFDYYFYNTASNITQFDGNCGDMNEVCWVKLTNGCVFAVDNYGYGAEHYVPSLSEWV